MVLTKENIEESRERDLKILNTKLQLAKEEAENCDLGILDTMFSAGEFIGYARLETEIDRILTIHELDYYSDKFISEIRNFKENCKCSKK